MRIEGSCQCGAVKFRVESGAPLSLPALLLFHLPQDPGRRRLCHQPRRRQCLAAGHGEAVHHRLPRPAEGPGGRPRPPLPGRAAFLRHLRQRPLAVRQPLAGAGPPLRLGDRYGLASGPGIHPHHAPNQAEPLMPLRDALRVAVLVLGRASTATQGALNSSITWVDSGATGKAVSIAEAKGWTSSGQRAVDRATGSCAQSAAEMALGRARVGRWRVPRARPGAGRGRSVTCSRPRRPRRLAALSAPRLMA